MAKKLPKQMVRVDVHSGTGSTYDTLQSHISYLSGMLESVPEEFRKDVQIDIDASFSYDYVEIETVIYYYRDETDEEYDARTKILRDANRNRKATVRKNNVAEFNKLARKLGQPEIVE